MFIFLFQSFPLGDKSSVNLRGEFHDSVIMFDRDPPKFLDDIGSMDLDGVASEQSRIPADQIISVGLTIPDPSQPSGSDSVPEKSRPPKFEAKKDQNSPHALNADVLYPQFWSMQEYFSAPTKLFEAANLYKFQRGLEVILMKFTEIQISETPIKTKSADEHKSRRGSKHGAKRKRIGEAEEIASSFSPKYLTSRDLFELEVCSKLSSFHHRNSYMTRSATLHSGVIYSSRHSFYSIFFLHSHRKRKANSRP